MYLYDASSIINLVKRGVIRVFAEGATLDLAVYESINALWMECYLFNRIRAEIAYKLLELLKGIFNTIDLYSMKGFEKEVFKMALEEGITIYDASYLYITMKNNLTLVTDDRKLKEVSSKHVKTLTSSQVCKL